MDIGTDIKIGHHMDIKTRNKTLRLLAWTQTGHCQKQATSPKSWLEFKKSNFLKALKDIRKLGIIHTEVPGLKSNQSYRKLNSNWETNINLVFNQSTWPWLKQTQNIVQGQLISLNLRHRYNWDFSQRKTPIDLTSKGKIHQTQENPLIWDNTNKRIAEYLKMIRT